MPFFLACYAGRTDAESKRKARCDAASLGSASQSPWTCCWRLSHRMPHRREEFPEEATARLLPLPPRTFLKHSGEDWVRWAAFTGSTSPWSGDLRWEGTICLPTS